MGELKVRDVPQDIVDWLDKEAEEKDMSRNKFVVWLLQVTREEWSGPRPVTVDTPQQAHDTAKAMRRELTTVKPTRDNLPGSRSESPRLGRKEPAPVYTPPKGTRVLPGDQELYAERDAAIARIGKTYTAEELRPEPGGRTCSHGHNPKRCPYPRCKISRCEA